jgi:plasmid stabilization system protein ParE
VVFAAEAAAEVIAITAWWVKHRTAAPGLFQAELREALVKIATYPEIGARSRVKGGADVRGFTLRRAGYVVFYDVDRVAEAIQVLRVRHGKRRPVRVKRR